jgi:serine phosphatase RsbU (regulator of sigma subunit)
MVAYTDGVSEAQNSQQDYYDEIGLIDSVKRNLGAQAEEISQAILDDVQEFMGETAQLDDIGLVVLKREIR